MWDENVVATWISVAPVLDIERPSVYCLNNGQPSSQGGLVSKGFIEPIQSAEHGDETLADVPKGSWNKRYVGAPSRPMPLGPKSRFLFIAQGRHRDTYLDLQNKRWVVKIPRDSEGAEANRQEAEFFGDAGRRPLTKELADYRRDNGPGRFVGAVYARCRLMKRDILVMELVKGALDIASNEDNYPSWAVRMDGGQVGYGRDGTLVCYDYTDF